MEKTKVICTVCKAEFNYHRSNSSLTYHLKAKHPTETISMGLRQSIVQDCGIHGRIMKPLSERVTNALGNWIATNGHPINIVEDDVLREIIQIASGDTS